MKRAIETAIRLDQHAARSGLHSSRSASILVAPRPSRQDLHQLHGHHSRLNPWELRRASYRWLRTTARLAQPNQVEVLPQGSSAHSRNDESSTKESNAAQEKSTKLSDRIRVLMRKYGWVSLAVYLGISVVDFGLTFAVVYAVGADHVRDAEDWVMHKLDWRRKEKERVETARQAVDLAADKAKQVGHEAQQAVVALSHGESPSSSLAKGSSHTSQIATTAVLAYAIHKTLLLPFRIGLTAWITPPLFRSLRRWGWNIGPAAASSAVVTVKPARES
ncbi:uncharacterized protein L969DRAFT_49637 [Mixia osmundae IAM 14324]|uniref:DUF1279 domain-containing protein n=1 Tax=Mixia osmundae (strain CBS 9802 / IAM 14324 / JCM 22182 / KY 12970) TaxID=764103 RepID=G7E0S0_MIXOS|nr:uncharacterized protein L969DRAFT_49637 [Mixia osmundae IAM 14324]KEI39463.1 hypothetical protein L969DRAFT_49637 [Mixia osmundae IAM 14324]GAA96430.1 hypothetical protein E5Q_03097 [Mixia osmundae IAM 14324]